MFRQLITNLDRASGGRLRRTADRAELPAYAGPVVSLCGGRAEAAGIEEFTVLQPVRAVRLDDERQRAFLARQTAVPNVDGAFQTEEAFRATLREVTFDPHSGAVWAADGALVLVQVSTPSTPAPALGGRSLRSTIAFAWLVQPLRPITVSTYVPSAFTVGFLSLIHI